ncbi:WD40 repeat-like protein [Basidiobolus meristosporus CBS 931.73]|uniref:WD40 repeat-like protein n=1 Tax=Basidiobolus meristosporus CBS 931.73 TaxID=1314790 RepID=A0A1Y1YF93_9FUNG|nr:WD40 repeat-like protein [Basidiobolus meristosporus CBS 931.73]|eukprot:ORX96573.1 WD40 repeat-like protein [Basidiobolus meristosporus CBS 931.73]
MSSHNQESSKINQDAPSPSALGALEKKRLHSETPLQKQPLTHPLNPHREIESYTCYRHRPDLRRAVDGPSLHALQQQLDQLPTELQSLVNQVWSTFGSAPQSIRSIILGGLLTQCCFPQLSYLSHALNPLLRIDFISVAPKEISLKIFSFLDAKSLCHAAQVSKVWKKLADDDYIWYQMCIQHIDKKCPKCGWGLPLLDNKSRKRWKIPAKAAEDASKRSIEGDAEGPASKRAKSEQGQVDSKPNNSAAGAVVSTDTNPQSVSIDVPNPSNDCAPPPPQRRPWKDIFCERLKVERNWRRGKFTTKVLKGHTDGVMCLQFDNTHLITGSYDHTVKVWDIESGELLRTLTGHTRCVRALQFNSCKLITGSMDSTLKIWNYRTGECIRTLEGHTNGIVCLHFDNSTLASGSVDGTIKIWNFSTGKCSTLSGHSDWVTKVAIFQQTQLFSCSDDTTIKHWDLQTLTCLRTFNGHKGQVQCLQVASHANLVLPLSSDNSTSSPQRPTATPNDATPNNALTHPEDVHDSPILISGALDNTIRVWSIKTGACIRTMFGHVEGVWSLAFDSLRIVSGAHDCMVKVWDMSSGDCMHTLTGHSGPVSCVGLSDTRIVTGSDDNEIRIWDFGAEA